MQKQHVPNNKKNNKKIASTNSTTYPSNQCNYRVKNTCPFLGKCLYENVIYKSTVKTNNSVKHYIGATDGIIKQRIYNHKLSFINKNYSFNTTLSSYIWHLKDINISPTITWEILKLAHAYKKHEKEPPLPPRKISHHNLSISRHPAT